MPAVAVAPSVTEADEFAADVRAHLTRSPRQLPSRYFYDDLGSALFDAICHLPWYPITRAERRLLVRHRDEILSAIHPLYDVVELGAGSGDKLALLLAAHRAASSRPLRVHLVDVSRAALDTASRTVGRRDVDVVTYQAGFLEWLERLRPRANDPGGGRMLAVFLGSNIGNFDRAGADSLLQLVRARLRPGDGLLLGADLVKAESALLQAYDDPLGLTAAFNRNLIVRINRELGARIDVAGFRHRAIWNAVESRVEMHLVSERVQVVSIPRAGVRIALDRGESIWTESSHKYDIDSLNRMFVRCGFRTHRQWTDEDAGFALTLALVPGTSDV